MFWLKYKKINFVVLQVYMETPLDCPGHVTKIRGPQGFWGTGEKGFLLSGSWGALVTIFRDLGSKLIVLWI